MVRHSKPVDAADRRSASLDAAVLGVLAVIAVSDVIVLAGCGSTAAGGAGHPASADAGHSTGPAAVASASAGVPLCAAAQKVDRVVASLPAGQLREILPRGITITDAPRVASRSRTRPGFVPWPPRSARSRLCRRGCSARLTSVGCSGWCSRQEGVTSIRSRSSCRVAALSPESGRPDPGRGLPSSGGC
jgi:hypothetical protein